MCYLIDQGEAKAELYAHMTATQSLSSTVCALPLDKLTFSQHPACVQFPMSFQSVISRLSHFEVSTFCLLEMGSHSGYMPEQQQSSSFDDSEVSSRDDIFIEKALLHSSSTCNCHSKSSHRHSYRAFLGHLIFLCIYSFIALGLVPIYSNAQPPCQTIETLGSDTYEWVHCKPTTGCLEMKAGMY